MRDDEKRYQTGFDAGMGAIIAVAIAPGLVIAVVSPEGRTVLGITNALLIGLFWYLYRTTHYTFEEHALRVQCGPIKLAIPYEDIRGAQSSASLMSGYAMSLQRIELEYARFDSVLIPPADRAGFLDELRRRAPQADIGPAD